MKSILLFFLFSTILLSNDNQFLFKKLPKNAFKKSNFFALENKYSSISYMFDKTRNKTDAYLDLNFSNSKQLISLGYDSKGFHDRSILYGKNSMANIYFSFAAVDEGDEKYVNSTSCSEDEEYLKKKFPKKKVTLVDLDCGRRITYDMSGEPTSIEEYKQECSFPCGALLTIEIIDSGLYRVKSETLSIYVKRPSLDVTMMAINLDEPTNKKFQNGLKIISKHLKGEKFKIKNQYVTVTYLSPTNIRWIEIELENYKIGYIDGFELEKID